MREDVSDCRLPANLRTAEVAPLLPSQTSGLDERPIDARLAEHGEAGQLRMGRDRAHRMVERKGLKHEQMVRRQEAPCQSLVLPACNSLSR